MVSSSVGLYIYLAVHRFFDPKIVLKYSQTEEVDKISEIVHPLIRECMKITEEVCPKVPIGTENPIEVTSFADIPSRGSGLGSSSAFAVGLIHALHAFKGSGISRERCAELACQVEIDRLKEPIGKQDQYAAACGGLNYIRFEKDGSVTIDPIIVGADGLRYLEDRLVMFYTGITRSASSVLSEQKANTESDEDKFNTLSQMRDMADELRDLLQKGQLDELGSFLHRGWELKRGLASKISTGDIDDIYETAQRAGAEGGKLLGAGGGGFFLFFCPPEKRQGLIDALSKLRPLSPRLDPQGTRLLYHDANG